MLIVPVVARLLCRLNTLHFSVLLFSPYCRWIVTKWNIAFCFFLVFTNLHGQPVRKKGREKNGLLFTPPNADMWSSLTVAFVVVDLTWSTFCVHIFRRQLQTNMAVRLCDVASLLRSGSWAPEPWTGVCGTFIFIFGNYLYRRALCLSAQAIPMIVLVL